MSVTGNALGCPHVDTGSGAEIVGIFGQDIDELIGWGPLDRPLQVTLFSGTTDVGKRDKSCSLRQLSTLVHADERARKSELPMIKLGRFGENRGNGKALRNDANLRSFCGVEGDHDAGTMSVSDAAARLRNARIAGVIYTSPSHTPEAPRWRVMVPTSKPLPPADRERLCARLNGVLEGALAPESFNLSQSFFYGRVSGAAEPELELVDGRSIDAAAELDATAIGRGGSVAAPAKRDRSAEAHGIACDIKRGGGGLGQFRAALAADPVLAEWAKDERQVQRTWDRAPAPSEHDFDDLPEIGTPERTQPLELIDPASWEGQPVPEREWALTGWLPKGQATYLTGPGSAGKSLMSQQLATCIALGLPFMGVPTEQGKALYWTCEDDAEELHRRQVSICKALKVSLESLSGKLSLISLAGKTDNELCNFSDGGELRPSKRFHALEATALAEGITFVALDNVAHLFPGNENIRHDVAAFASLLNRLAASIGGSVLFIGHPNKAGDAYSGSTAWENQVRSRLFLTTPGEEGSIADRDARVLSRGKANYAQNGAEIHFYWHEWAFVTEDALPVRYAPEAKAQLEDEVFLRCLEKAKAEQRATSPSSSASNYAPKVFAAMPLGKGVSVKGFEAAMHRLLDLGYIRNAEPVYKRDNRTWAKGLGVVSSIASQDVASSATSDAQTLHKPLHKARSNQAQSAPEPARTGAIYTMYI